MNSQNATQGDESDRPETDQRAEYDYVSNNESRRQLVTELNSRVDGDVRFDEYSRQLYATDASAYEVTPVGVVMPKTTEDVAAVLSYCAEQGVPVLPRGGGTSLAGQAVNEAVVLDFTRYMGSVKTVSVKDQTARVEAGTVLADLNAVVADEGLKFAPDPAARDRSTVGGAIGNNSTGAHSLKYGKTDAYVEQVEAVLADGTVTTLGAIDLEEVRRRAAPDGDLLERIYAIITRIVDQEHDAVLEAFPVLKRNVSGYNLAHLVEEAETGTVNLARLLAGSEGTLAIVTEATVSLEPLPAAKAAALLTYRNLDDAMRDVHDLIERHDPAAIEAVDEVLIELARETDAFEAVATRLPDETKSALLVEFYAENDEDGGRKVETLLQDCVKGKAVAETNENDPHEKPRRAFDALEAHDPDSRAMLWKLRKSGNPILLSRTTDAKHISFIEDAAVPTEYLADFVAGFQDVLDEQDTFASFYGHAGPGCMHIRPLVDTKTVEGVERMEAISDGVTDLVVEYDGSVSGEHGDGRARTQWNHKLYGDHVWELFRDVKSAFDPDWLLNPGQVCGDVKMTENLRFGPEYSFDAGFDSSLNWQNDNEFEGMVELCHGCGGCRSSQENTGGVMCPTYRAANEEITATRGRANLLRQAMSGNFSDEEQFDVEFMHEVLDLCVGCKGCISDCPSEVDMAKLKVEVSNEYHRRHGASLRDHAFANIDRLAALGSNFAPISNWGASLPGARLLLEKTVGLARERSLPTFQHESFEDWYAARGCRIPERDAERKVLLVPDTDTNYSHPQIAKAAVQVLETAGVHVRVPDGVTSSGRAAHSKGFVEKARGRARTNIDALHPFVEDGWDVVVVEPSDAVMYQHDYFDLLDGKAVERVAGSTFGVCEYLDVFPFDIQFTAPEESLVYHGHCHQKATMKDTHAVSVLRAAGYEVDMLDSGCCGMAGSFGYEAEHYSMSRAIGRILFDQVALSPAETVVAPGASCRTQLGDRDENAVRPPHPIEKLAAALSEVALGK